MTCDAQPYEAVKKREMPSDARRDTQRCDAQRCAAMPRDATKDALGKIGSDARDARRCQERWLSKNKKQYNPVKKTISEKRRQFQAMTCDAQPCELEETRDAQQCQERYAAMHSDARKSQER